MMGFAHRLVSWLEFLRSKIEVQIHKTVEQEETGRDGKKEKQREVANIQLAPCWTHRPCSLTTEVIQGFSMLQRKWVSKVK